MFSLHSGKLKKKVFSSLRLKYRFHPLARILPEIHNIRIFSDSGVASYNAASGMNALNPPSVSRRLAIGRDYISAVSFDFPNSIS
jgi:hypothetical protein